MKTEKMKTEKRKQKNKNRLKETSFSLFWCKDVAKKSC